MNRILILLASLLLVGVPQVVSGACYSESGSNEVFTSEDAREYKLNCKYPLSYHNSNPCGLSIADDGAWGRANSHIDAGWCSLQVCRQYSEKPETCQVVDVGYESDGKWEIPGLQPEPNPTPTPTPAPAPTPAPTPTPEPDYQLVSTGTGFVVNKIFVVTADHVLRKNERGDACDALSIVYRKDEYEAQGVDADPANDLGLIKLSKPIESTTKLRGQPDLIQGEMAVNYGFPLMGELSTSAKVTGGSVNSLSGYNNNSSFLQYDAASQHGNSGGPVLDASGNIIGVVSSKLDDAETQLVNFATKSTILEGFLKANKVPFEKADLGEKLELPDIAEKAETFTVLVGCWE